MGEWVSLPLTWSGVPDSGQVAVTLRSSILHCRRDARGRISSVGGIIVSCRASAVQFGADLADSDGITRCVLRTKTRLAGSDERKRGQY
jgi:hypothetical protein